MKLSLENTDVIDLLSEVFPNSYNYRINQAKNLLILKQKDSRCSASEAFNLIIEHSKNYIPTLLLFAALYQIESEAINENTSLINKLSLIEETKAKYKYQLEALPNTKFKDKETIGAFYRRQISRYNDQIKSLVNRFNTVNPIFINPESC